MYFKVKNILKNSRHYNIKQTLIKLLVLFLVNYPSNKIFLIIWDKLSN